MNNLGLNNTGNSGNNLGLNNTGNSGGNTGFNNSSFNSGGNNTGNSGRNTGFNNSSFNSGGNNTGNSGRNTGFNNGGGSNNLSNNASSAPNSKVSFPNKSLFATMNKPDFAKNQGNMSQPKPMFTGMMGTKTPNFINSIRRTLHSLVGYLVLRRTKIRISLKLINSTKQNQVMYSKLVITV